MTTPEWITRGEAAFYRAVIDHNGKEVWYCEHKHELKSDATACARRKLATLKKERNKNNA